MNDLFQNIPEELITILQSVSNKNRLAILLALLTRGEMTFKQLATGLNLQGNGLSHHLKNLTQAGLVSHFLARKGALRDYSYYKTSILGENVIKNLFHSLEVNIAGKETPFTPTQDRILQAIKVPFGDAKPRVKSEEDYQEVSNLEQD